MFIDIQLIERQRAPAERDVVSKPPATFRSDGAAQLVKPVDYRHFVPLGLFLYALHRSRTIASQTCIFTFRLFDIQETKRT